MDLSKFNPFSSGEDKSPNTTKGERISTIGDTGLDRSGGYVRDDFLPNLNGAAATKVYKEMAANDPVVGAFLFAINGLIRNVTWDVKAADDTDAAKKGKEFLEEVLEDMSKPLSDVVSEICTMFTYGYAPMEIIYKYRRGPEKNRLKSSDFTDGQLGIGEIALRAQESIARWTFDESGHPTGLYQMPQVGPEVFIPIEKILLFRTTAVKNNPTGRSILRNAYRPWLFKNRIEEIEGIGIERDLAGLPVVRVPNNIMTSDATADQKKVLGAYQDLVKGIRRDEKEGVVLPSDRDEKGHLFYDLELLSSSGSRQFDTTKIIDRYSKSMASTVLADFIFLGQSTQGSFALSSNKTALFSTALGSFLKSVVDVLNEGMVTNLWRYNGFPVETRPIIQHGDLEKPDLVELGTFVAHMANSGARLFPDTKLENRLRGAMSMPPLPAEVSGDEVPVSNITENNNDNSGNRSSDVGSDTDLNKSLLSAKDVQNLISTIDEITKRLRNLEDQ